MARRRSKPSPRTTELPLITGVRAVQEAFKSKRLQIKELLVTATVRARQDLNWIFEQAKKSGIACHTIDASDYPQGIACRVSGLPTLGVHELLVGTAKGNLLALDRIQDPMNLGAILRSANACGVRAVICPKDHTAPLTEVVIKASAGAALYTPVIYVTNLARTLEELKEAHYWIVGLVPPDAAPKVQSLATFSPPSPWVLLAGSEGSGLRPLVQSRADFLVSIPMQGEIESLNVSAASAIALFTLSHHPSKPA